MASGKIYVAKFSGFADLDGRQVHVQEGVTRVREGHPLLKGREDVFEEIGVHYDLEDARSAPQDEGRKHAPKTSDTSQPEAGGDTASHEGPASVDPPVQGPKSDDPPNQGPESNAPVPPRPEAVATEDTPVTEGPVPAVKVRQRGPRRNGA